MFDLTCSMWFLPLKFAGVLAVQWAVHRSIAQRQFFSCDLQECLCFLLESQVLLGSKDCPGPPWLCPALRLPCDFREKRERYSLTCELSFPSFVIDIQGLLQEPGVLLLQKSQPFQTTKDPFRLGFP